MSMFANRYNPISQTANVMPRTTGTPPGGAGGWEEWFGPPAERKQPSVFSEYATEHKTLPDAYIGANQFLAEKISGLVNTTGEFWTTVLLPWFRSDNIGTFSWTTWRFNQVLADRLPHEGVPRLVTTSEKQFMTSTVRRGLAAEFEADFIKTLEGQITMARKIQGMIICVQTTINMDVQHTIVMANDQRKMENQRIRTNRLPMQGDIEWETEMFNMIQKTPYAFDLHYARVKKYLQEEGATNFALLVTPEVVLQLSHRTLPTPPEDFRFLGGSGRPGDPTSQLGRTDLPTGDTTLRDGTQLFEVRSIPVSSQAPPMQMFTRSVLIGEYYLINWGSSSRANLYDGCSQKDGKISYCSDHRTILIHDMETDKMAAITLRDCLFYGGRAGFPDMEIVNKLSVNNYEIKDFYPQNDPHGPGHRSNSKNLKRRAHMMLFYQSGQGTRVVHHFGNMDDNVTSDHSFMQIARTLVSSVPGLGEQDMRDAADMLELLKQLEDAPYKDSFFQELIRANITESAQGNVFKGEKLFDPELINKWKLTDFDSEWTPQYHGGLKLPMKTAVSLADVDIPPGMSNLAGLYSLQQAYLSNADSGWGELPARADRAIRLLKKLYAQWNSVLDSEATKASNRYPWFHAKDGLYTFFDNVIYMPRDPLFMIVPQIATGPGTGRAGASKVERPYVSDIPGTVESAVYFNTTGTADRNFTGFKSLINTPGILSSIGPRVLDATTRALLTMGDRSGVALVGIMAALRGAPTSINDKMRNFAELILRAKPNISRKIVLTIWEKTGGDSTEINDIYDSILGKDVSKDQRDTILKDLYDDDIVDLTGDSDVVGFDKPNLAKALANMPRDTASGTSERPPGGAGSLESRVEFDSDALDEKDYRRTPLAMTPGIAKTIGRAEAPPLVLPSDPKTGHTTPITKTDRGGRLEEYIIDRVQYGTFIGSSIPKGEMPSGKSPMGDSHIDFLRAAYTGNVSGTTIRDASFSSRDVFGATMSSSTVEDEFDEGGIVESLASALTKNIGAHKPYQWKEPIPPSYEGYVSTSTRYDRRRPFSSLVESGLIIADYDNGRKEIDSGDGIRLLFEIETDNMRKHLSEAAKIPNPIVKWAAFAILLSRCDHLDHWLRLVDSDVNVPCNVLLQRFRQEFLMDSFVLMQPGSRTGATLFAHASSMISWAGIVRRAHLNFAFYSKAIVWSPEFIFVLENVLSRRYVRGAGVSFMTSIDDIIPGTPGGSHDIVSIIIPIEEQKFYDSIGITGDIFVGQVDVNRSMEQRKGVTTEFSSADYFKEWFTNPDRSIEKIVDQAWGSVHKYTESQGTLPTILFQGHQQNFTHGSDGEDRGWTSIVYCTKGHRGKNGAYPGCKAVYNRTNEMYFKQDPVYPAFPSS
jgi:hypothetical protein